MKALFVFWSGRGDLNSRSRPWQGRVLAARLRPQKWCWYWVARPELLLGFLQSMADPKGIDPSPRHRQCRMLPLHHGSKLHLWSWDSESNGNPLFFRQMCRPLHHPRYLDLFNFQRSKQIKKATVFWSPLHCLVSYFWSSRRGRISPRITETVSALQSTHSYGSDRLHF